MLVVGVRGEKSEGGARLERPTAGRVRRRRDEAARRRKKRREPREHAGGLADVFEHREEKNSFEWSLATSAGGAAPRAMSHSKKSLSGNLLFCAASTSGLRSAPV